MSSIRYEYIVDDRDQDIQYLCPISAQSTVLSYFNSSWTSVADESCSRAWFTYKFNGTRVTISAPFRGSASGLSIDNGPVTPCERGVCRSSILSDGEHTLVFSAGISPGFPAFDYLTVSAGSSTSQKERTWIINDDDADIAYSGSWTTEPPIPYVLGYSTSPYRNTTHWSSTIGDSLSFRFAGKSFHPVSSSTLHTSYLGSSIAIFGILQNSTITGNVTVSYAVDGGNPIVLPLAKSIYGQTMPMAKLFETVVDPEAPHTITLNVTDIKPPHAFGFDFLVYNASFDPSVLTPVAATSTSSSDHLGPILGGVLGGLATIGLLGLLFFAWRRKRMPRHTKNDANGDWFEIKTAATKMGA